MPVDRIRKRHFEIGKKRAVASGKFHIRRNIRPFRHGFQRDFGAEGSGVPALKGNILDAVRAVDKFVLFKAGVQLVLAPDLIGKDRAGHPAAGVEGDRIKAVGLYHVDRDSIAGNVRLEDNAAQRAGKLHRFGEIELCELRGQKIRPDAAGNCDFVLHRHETRKLRADGGAESDGGHVLFHGRALVHTYPFGKPGFHLRGNDNVGGGAAFSVEIGTQHTAQPLQHFFKHHCTFQSAQRNSRARTV